MNRTFYLTADLFFPKHFSLATTQINRPIEVLKDNLKTGIDMISNNERFRDQ